MIAPDALETKPAEELVEQAWLCFRLIHEINDQSAIATIRAIGWTYIDAAIAAGASADSLPRFGIDDEHRDRS
jgi:hypothetical protein